MKRVENLSLDGEWDLINESKSINISTIVPGSIYEALIDNNLIEDPFYGEREHEMSWVYDSDWIYEKKFKINAEFLQFSNICLQLKGIDTISDIFLNDKLLGSTKNMFITYKYDVKSLLKEGQNLLKVIIRSPTEYALKEIEKYGTKLHNMMGIPGIPYLRKAQYSFGWDWGPKIPDIAIWQSVDLIGYDTVKIESIYPQQTFNYSVNPLKIKSANEIENIHVNSVSLLVKIQFTVADPNLTLSNYTLKANLKGPKGELLFNETKIDSAEVQIKLEIKNPQLWWTNDLGKQQFYDLSVEIYGDQMIDYQKMRLGIRDIKLIQNPDDWGETFYFMLNGIPVFAKGANWIPIDSFIPRGKKLSLYQKNLAYAKEANMNFIRVWGGGIYEDDLFYDICDELGILIWQDFPFACAIYPIHNEFFESVREEAIQNIKRIRHHPSLALWCGNNEIEYLFLGYIGLYHMFNPKKI